MISRNWLGLPAALAALLVALVLGVMTSSAENRPAGSDNVVIQMVATASNNGELEECG